MDFKSSSNKEKIITIICIVGMALWFIFGRSSFYGDDSSSSNSYKLQYTNSYYDAVGNKVIINCKPDGSGTIKMEYAKTSSGLEEYMSKEPIACSWEDRGGYYEINSRAGDIYIKDGYAYFDYYDMKAKDTKRGCKLN